MLPLDIDPKLAWALNHRDQFPVDLNRASKEQLLKVPGLGVKTVKQLLRIRRWQKIKLQEEDSEIELGFQALRTA